MKLGKTMESEEWVTDLIVETDQLEAKLESVLAKSSAQIVVKYGADGARDRNWIYGKIFLNPTNKLFRFGIFVLTGKALVLFVQYTPGWLVQHYIDILKKECLGWVKRQPKKRSVDYNWSSQTDEFCGAEVGCFIWIGESQFTKDDKKRFIDNLLLEYQELWKEK